VGWYNAGTIPGERGSAVIDGHLDRPGGYPAVFWNLRYVQVGDAVIVVNRRGKTLHFHVTRILFYPPQDAPVQDIFGNTAGTFLNLITCAGDWIPSQHQTTLRLVVYTTLD
jgi:sortase (surface protein transpeptidase)